MTDNKPDNVEEVLEQFDNKKERLTEFCGRTKALIEECLKDANIQFQSVQARVKRRSKLKTKYLDPKKKYTKLDDITDQAALRVITYYDDELDPVSEIIKREFTILPEHSSDKRETDPDRFGYYAINYVCCHSPKRTQDVEYKKYADIRFEIQITSILRHAWSEIEHEWYDLKDEYPDPIKRKFYRLAALLEIAESEFRALRKQRNDYQRSVALQVEANVTDIPLDALSLKTFIAADVLVSQMDQRNAELAGSELHEPGDAMLDVFAKLARRAGLSTLTELQTALVKDKDAIMEYLERVVPLWRKDLVSGSVPRGVSILNLAMFRILSEGRERFLEVLGSLNLVMASDDTLDQEIAIVREITSRR